MKSGTLFFDKFMDTGRLCIFIAYVDTEAVFPFVVYYDVYEEKFDEMQMITFNNDIKANIIEVLVDIDE